MPSSSPIWPQASAEWSRLSIEAPSTWRTKPFGLPCSSEMAFSVISFSVGSVPRLAGVHLVVAEPAPVSEAISGLNSVVMLRRGTGRAGAGPGASDVTAFISASVATYL